jgi:hypothetical protein
MTQMLLDPASQIPAVIKELQDAQFVNILSLLAVGFLALVLTSGCSILLARTAAGTLNSRFLRHLAIAFAIHAANVLVSIIYVLLKAALAFFALDMVKQGNPVPISISQGLNTMNSTFHGISIMNSLLSNVFLFAAWDLLRQYPNQGVSKSLFTILTTFFGSGSLLIVLINLLAIFEKAQKHFWPILHAIDLVSSAVGILLVGWQLQKTLGSRITRPIWKATLPWMTFIAYLIWAGSQLVHQWLRWFSWYGALLLVSALGAAIMTIILCSYALEEKPEYSSNQASG